MYDNLLMTNNSLIHYEITIRIKILYIIIEPKVNSINQNLKYLKCESQKIVRVFLNNYS